MRKPSKNTLLGRVHLQIALEARHDVEGLYELIDPTLRARRERERDDEPGQTLAALREHIESITSAEIESVEVLEAKKSSELHEGRPAAIVRSTVVYSQEPRARSRRAVWVRHEGHWYSTASALGGGLEERPEE